MMLGARRCGKRAAREGWWGGVHLRERNGFTRPPGSLASALSSRAAWTSVFFQWFLSLHLRSPMPERVKLLMLACNPAGDLGLDEEARAASFTIRNARARDAFELQSEWAVRVRDLQRHLLWHKPGIVHFSGHGDRSQGIYLVDDRGNEIAIAGEGLRRLFAVLNRFVHMVVLNACDTLVIAESLSTVVDYAIGMRTAISDGAATAFTDAFYGALASDLSVRESFDLARAQLALEFPEESDTPALLIREGVDRRTSFIALASGWRDEAGLLFDIPEEFAGEFISVTAEGAARLPHEYGREWLLELFSYGRGPVRITSSHVFDRFALLLEAFYEEPALARGVDGLLGELLRAGAAPEALELVKRLRRCGSFDEYHWLRRIAESGDEWARSTVRNLVFNELIRGGTRVYSLLERIKEWLPVGNDGSRYTLAGLAALQLLPEYAIATIRQWESEGQAGSRSAYPLLAIDQARLACDASLLAYWLTHPAFPAVYGEGDEGAEGAKCTVAGLIATWVLILDAAGTEESQFASADQVLDALLKALVRHATGPRVAEMEVYWDQMRIQYDRAVGLEGWFARAKRRELARKRDLMQSLVNRSRQTRWAPQLA